MEGLDTTPAAIGQEAVKGLTQTGHHSQSFQAVSGYFVFFLSENFSLMQLFRSLTAENLFMQEPRSTCSGGNVLVSGCFAP